MSAPLSLSALARVAALLLLCLAPVGAAIPVQLRVFVGQFDDVAPPVTTIRVGYTTLDDDSAHEPFAIESPGGPDTLRDKSRYRLIATQGAESELVPIERVRISGIDGGRVSAVDLIPARPLKADFQYRVELAPGALPLASGFRHVEAGDDLRVSAAELSAELDYLRMRTFQNKLELLGGEEVGAGSLQYSYRLYLPPAPGSRGLFFLEASAQADFDFASRDDRSYFNSLVAKLSSFRVDTWKVNDGFRGAWFLGLDVSLESDRNFETVDAAGGAAFKVHVKNPVTTFLHDAVLDLTSSRAGTRGRLLDAGVAPLFSVGYDFVSHIERGPGVETGQQRLKVGLHWDWPLVRARSLLGLTPPLDADLLIALEAVHDGDRGEWHNASRVVFDVRQRDADDDAFSFTLTYARGRVTPRYEHVDTLLFGIKQPF